MKNDESEETDLEFDAEGDGASVQTGEKQNYISPTGMAALKKEYHDLFHGERPKLVEVIAWAASNGDRSENGDYIYGKRRLREIDRRLRFLGGRMANAVVVENAGKELGTVQFGAKVTVSDEDGKKLFYIIVGEDEINLDQRKISWVSPVAKALLGSKEGDVVTVKRPNGDAELEVLKIEYPKI